MFVGADGVETCALRTGADVLSVFAIDAHGFWTNVALGVMAFALFRVAAFAALRLTSRLARKHSE